MNSAPTVTSSRHGRRRTPSGETLASASAGSEAVADRPNQIFSARPAPAARAAQPTNEAQVNSRILIFPRARVRAPIGTSRVDSTVKCAHCQKRLALLPTSGWDDPLFCSASHRAAYRKARQQDSRVAQFLQWLSARRPSPTGPAA
jgi:hypothetical protein